MFVSSKNEKSEDFGGGGGKLCQLLSHDPNSESNVARSVLCNVACTALCYVARSAFKCNVTHIALCDMADSALCNVACNTLYNLARSAMQCGL